MPGIETLFPALPPLPRWEAAHPIIVHLPIGMLAATPVLIAIAMFAKRMRQPMAFMALIVLVLGAGTLWAAVASGEATEYAVSIPADARATLSEHERLGEISRNVFTGIAAGYALVLVGAIGMGEKFKRSGWIAAHVLMLLAVAWGLLILSAAGHNGGKLVHEFGVHAPMSGEPSLEFESGDGGF